MYTHSFQPLQNRDETALFRGGIETRPGLRDVCQANRCRVSDMKDLGRTGRPCLLRVGEVRDGRRDIGRQNDVNIKAG